VLVSPCSARPTFAAVAINSAAPRTLLGRRDGGGGGGGSGGGKHNDDDGKGLLSFAFQLKLSRFDTKYALDTP